MNKRHYLHAFVGSSMNIYNKNARPDYQDGVKWLFILQRLQTWQHCEYQNIVTDKYNVV
jgi:hypothetical protein